MLKTWNTKRRSSHRELFWKKVLWTFFLKQKIKNLKIGQSHWKTLRYILLKISSSISISQEYLPRPQEDLFCRTALDGVLQILKYKKKKLILEIISIKQVYSLTILKLEPNNLIEPNNKSKDSQKLKRVPYVLKNHNIY